MRVSPTVTITGDTASQGRIWLGPEKCMVPGTGRGTDASISFFFSKMRLLPLKLGYYKKTSAGSTCGRHPRPSFTVLLLTQS
jgi:hypothetical protein